MIYALTSKRVDGIIIAPNKTQIKGIEYLLEQDYPFVLIDRFYQNLDTNYVIVDNFKSSYEVVDFMVGRGARKIALLVTDTHLYVMKKRMEGYRAALRDAGISNNLSWEVFCGSSDLCYGCL